MSQVSSNKVTGSPDASRMLGWALQAVLRRSCVLVGTSPGSSVQPLLNCVLRREPFSSATEGLLKLQHSGNQTPYALGGSCSWIAHSGIGEATLNTPSELGAVPETAEDRPQAFFLNYIPLLTRNAIILGFPGGLDGKGSAYRRPGFHHLCPLLNDSEAKGLLK